jgi:peroxiredoxin Q/BCP
VSALRRSLAGAALACFATSLPVAVAGAQATPKVGDLAPDFTLAAATKNGVRPTPVRLSELRGQTVVLAFFPKAHTSGCTAQMEHYRDKYKEIFRDGKGVTLIAISADDDSTLWRWARDKKFPMLFASDTGRIAGRAYGVLWNLVVTTLEKRVAFVIGPDGRITHIMRPFKELTEDSYTQLGAAIAKAAGPVRSAP